MPQFHYRATTPDGAAIEDTIEAPSAHQATLRLQERGYSVNSVTPVQAEFARAGRAKQLSWPELELLAQQLLSITERNLPLVPSLRAFTGDMASSPLKGVVDQIRIDLERGATMDEALRNRGNALPPLFASAMKAGEASGAGLPGVLRILVQHSSRMIHLQNSLHTALTYPMLVVSLAGFVMLVLTWHVMPNYAALWTGEGLISTSRLMRPFAATFVALGKHPVFASLMVVGFAAGLLGLTVFLTRSYATSLRADRFKLRMPRFGHVYYAITIARFSRTLSALMRARVPIVEALELAAAASGSPMLQQAVGSAAPRVAIGAPLADALLATGYFAPSYCWLLGTAERRNAAEEALENLAESNEREASAYDQINMQIVGPIALMVAGLIVLLVSIQFISPLGSMFAGDVISGT